jgi:hypothetical protein
LLPSRDELADFGNQSRGFHLFTFGVKGKARKLAA